MFIIFYILPCQILGILPCQILGFLKVRHNVYYFLYIYEPAMLTHSAEQPL